MEKQILTTKGAPSPKEVKIAISSMPSKVCPLSPESEQGSSIYGISTWFPFRIPISSPSTFNSFTISSPGFLDSMFPAQMRAFIVPSLSTLSGTNTSSTSDSLLLSPKE